MSDYSTEKIFTQEEVDRIISERMERLKTKLGTANVQREVTGELRQEIDSLRYAVQELKHLVEELKGE